MDQQQYRKIPSVAKLIEEPALASYPHAYAVDAARQAIEEAREQATRGAEITPEQILERAVEHAERLQTPAFAPAINCSGAILNTGLGRARLAKAAVDAIRAAADSHSTLEVNRETGARGDRQAGLRALLCRLTDAESALVVNNNAAAVLLAVNTIAQGKRVLLSRGQSVEIGGSFRMPDVVRQAGGILVDVGCTNRTRVRDYEEAFDEETGLILRCHPSNFVLRGFVEEPTVSDLAACAHRLGVPLLDDVGSGCLIETERFGLPHEPTLRDSLSAGADLVTASGDKLLGGTQAGILLGKREWIEKIAKNPLARAVRIDKLTAAGLEATLRLYVEGREHEIPTIRYLSRTPEDVHAIAKELVERLAPIPTRLDRGETEVGGGSLPGVTLPTSRVGFPGADPEALARALRMSHPPVFGYIQDDLFWLDPRTLDEDEVDVVVAAVRGALS